MSWQTFCLFTDREGKGHRIQARDIPESTTTKVRWQYQPVEDDQWRLAWSVDADGNPTIHKPDWMEFQPTQGQTVGE